jgi:hypothetical protein
MKFCKRCKKEKEYIEFNKQKKSKDGYNTICKLCKSEKSKEYYKNNREKVKKRVKEYRNDNLDEVNKQVKEYYMKNRDELLEYKRNYYKENKERFNELNLKYRENNKDLIKEQKRKYISKKRKEDILFRIKENISRRINQCLKNKGFKKEYRSEEILCCKIDEFKEYIESQFDDGMKWEKHGEWYLDHKTPISWTETEQEVYDLNHYSNFQPLWAKDNLSKGNRYKDI